MICFQAPPDFHFVSAETKYTEQGRKAKKYKVVDKAHEDKPLTYEAFLTKLETNDDFLDDFVDVLRRGLQSFSDMDMTPYFFETPPVTLETLNSTVFEFVLVAAREFNQALPSPGYELIYKFNLVFPIMDQGRQQLPKPGWASSNAGCRLIFCQKPGWAINLKGVLL